MVNLWNRSMSRTLQIEVTEHCYSQGYRTLLQSRLQNIATVKVTEHCYSQGYRTLLQSRLQNIATVKVTEHCYSQGYRTLLQTACAFRILVYVHHMDSNSYCSTILKLHMQQQKHQPIHALETGRCCNMKTPHRYNASTPNGN